MAFLLQLVQGQPIFEAPPTSLAVKAVSEPTCWALCYRDVCCLSSVRTYLPGTVLKGCRLFKRCRNLPAGHCVAGVHAV